MTDDEGRYRFRSFLPPGYAIPPSGPTAEIFSTIGRHGNRPAHIHYLIAAPGLRTLTTQVNVPGDSFIDDDFAFATRDGLILTLEKGTSPRRDKPQDFAERLDPDGSAMLVQGHLSPA